MSRIIVGLSGGVDSSVAAYLLQKAGHEVIGCRMRTFDTLSSREEEESAALVADRLGIPLYTVDMRTAFAGSGSGKKWSCLLLRNMRKGGHRIPAVSATAW